MSFIIRGIGTATPPHHIDQAEAAEWATGVSANRAHQATVAKLYRRVGVRSRHSVLLNCGPDGVPAHKRLYLPAESDTDRGPTVAARMRAYELAAAPLAEKAARKALEAARTDAREITHLVTVSCSGFMAPGCDIALIQGLELSPGVRRTHVGFMGCHGALNALRVAQAFAESDPQARVLICAVELCSLHHQYQGGVDQIVANALFADGAAAVVGGGKDDSQSPPLWRLAASGSTLIPETQSCMSWHIRDHGFEMGLSPEVPAVIERTLNGWLSGWLHDQDLSLADIGCWAIHPGGPRILQACQRALELDDAAMSPSQETLADFGNMSSPTVLFIVERLQRTGCPPPCVMLAFGPGLTAEVALLR